MKLELLPRAARTPERSKTFCHRALLLVLLLAVPALSTLAKTNWYLPAGNAGHHLTAAVKMKVAHAPAAAAWHPLEAALNAVPATPPIRIFPTFQLETFPLATAFAIDFQHRPPPAGLNR